LIVPTHGEKEKSSYNRKMTKKKTITFIILIGLLLSISFTACSRSEVVQNTTDEVPLESSTQTEPRKLTICLGYEPSSLYLYKASTQVEWDILQAIYDGPFDTVDGKTIPVILQSMPSIENKGIQINQLTVQGGETILDAFGKPTVLSTGTRYLPSGCTSVECAQVWNGSEPITLDQVQITYQLKSGLLWSDGTPLTAEDSDFSFNLADDPATPNDKTIPNQIASYRSLDSDTVQAQLLPGLVPADVKDYFFSPLPIHAWEGTSAAELLEADFSNQTPLGWGAYTIKAWKDGSVLLEKNPYYFRSSEGLPYFDELEFRFVSNLGDTNVASLDFDYAPYEILEYNWSPDGETVYTDQCDLADSTVDFSDQYDVFDYLTDYYITPAIQVNALPNSILDGLWLNPEHPFVTSLRSVLSSCIDRTYVNSKTYYKLAFPTDSIFSIAQSSEEYGYSLEDAAQKLEAMGWLDDDEKYETPRVAHNVTGVEDGTQLTLTMVIPNEPVYDRESAAIQASLQECGIQMDIKTVNTWDYESQNGPASTHDFDLMLFSHVIQAGFPCTSWNEKWTSAILPGSENLEQQVTQLCSTSRLTQSMGLDNKTADAVESTLPLIPLFFQADVSIARADMCGFIPTVGSSSDLWNLEKFNYGESCLQ
jgi:peptide/nickel transport system substrate-binding protein